MKQYLIHICYQTRTHRTASIHEMDIVSHSIQDAKAAFSLWQLKTHPENIINGGKPKFKIIAAAKLAEVVAADSRKEWLRIHTEQIKNQIYACPHCQCVSQVSLSQRDSRYCTGCGKEVIHDEKIKDETD